MQQDLSLESASWQASLNPVLMRRLLRSVQPGVMKPQFAEQVVARTQRLGNRLPLLVQFAQRQHGMTSHQVDQPPIVYAQHLPQPEARQPAAPSLSSSSPSVSGSPPVIQAKFADPAPSPTPSKPPTVVQAKFSQSAAIAPARPISSPAPLTSKLPTSEQSPLASLPIASPAAPANPSSVVTQPVLNSTPQANAAPANPSSVVTQPVSNNIPQARTRAIAQIPTSSPLFTPTFTQSPIPEQSISEQPAAAVAPSSLQPVTRPVVQPQQSSTAIAQTEPLAKRTAEPTQLNHPNAATQPHVSQAADRLGSPTVYPQPLSTPSLETQSLQPLPSNDSLPNFPPPRIQVSNGAHQALPVGSQATQQRVPLVFANPLVLAAQAYLEQEAQKAQQGSPSSLTAMSSQVASPRSPLTSHQPGVSSTPTAPLPAQPQFAADNAQVNAQVNAQAVVDVEAITKQVERRLMQRLVIENERRGTTRWH